MWALLGSITQRLVVAIPVMLVAGFGCGAATDAAFLKSLILPFTFLMVYPMMVTLKIRQVLEGGDLKAQLLTQAINFAVIPFVAFAAGQYFFSDSPYLALGLLLAALVPTSGMTISWTGFAGGNLAAAVKMTVVGLILGSLATPFYVKLLLGASVEVSLGKVFQQIILIVFLPMAAGYATQRFLVRRYGREAFQQRLAPRFPGLSTLGVLGIVFIAMALKAPEIAAHPEQLVRILLPLALLYSFNFFFSTLIGRLALPRADAIALVYGTVMRNLSIALAVAINAFGPAGSDAALVIALAYVIQVQSAAWYVKFTPHMFGPAEAAAQTS
ncbi:MAG: bile acid:sodium symporter [Desulfuromonadales bacterium]|jgi:ACR3 family arsenite efflux pump ArsB